VRRFQENDLGSERVLIGPAATDSQRHTGAARVRLEQVRVPAIRADRCAECNSILHQRQLPVFMILVKLDASQRWLSLATSIRWPERGIGPGGHRGAGGMLGLEWRQSKAGKSRS
jgi:hypothetical protein